MPVGAGLNEPLETYYPRFALVTPPQGTGAIQAWHGYVCPLPIGANLGPITSALADDPAVDVGFEGEISHANACHSEHAEPTWLDCLQRMDITFELLVLEFEHPKHPQVFSVSPRINRQIFPVHPHLRDDQRIYTPHLSQALCLYLASDNVYPSGYQLKTLLDFASIWLAKHLIWQRTSEWFCFRRDLEPFCIYFPGDGRGCATWRSEGWHGFGMPNDLGHVRNDVRNFSFRGFLNHVGRERHYCDEWRGKWVGTYAPHTPQELLRTVKPGAECPCGKGRAYKNCCLELHKSMAN